MRPTLVDVIIRGVILVLVLGYAIQSSRAYARLQPTSNPSATRGGEQSVETRLALIQQEKEHLTDKVDFIQTQQWAVINRLNEVEKTLTAIKAVAEANTSANWIIGSGFAGQFLFSLFRYLNARNGKSVRPTP